MFLKMISAALTVSPESRCEKFCHGSVSCTQLERELSKVLAGGRNFACIKEEEPEELTKQGEDLSNSCDPTTDIIGCDPAMETKILKKIAAVKERLSVWMRRLHEYV